MVHALGYSQGKFDPADPGRLCRGRERWIEGFPVDEDLRLHRVVVSGAVFSDDSAHDAKRGLAFSGMSLGKVLDALFPASTLVGWAEDAHPDLIPGGVRGVEHYEVRRMGGPLVRWSCRWAMVVPPGDRAATIDDAVERGVDAFLVGPTGLDGKPGKPGGSLAAMADEAPGEPTLPEPLSQGLYLLTGQRQDGHPSRLFQASALVPLLDLTEAVALVHLDKHAPCIGVYTRQERDESGVLEGLAKKRGSLGVQFAIPPMLARWDRALWELRQDWDEAGRGEYPVPPARGGSPSWGRRGHRSEE